jgi:hypothetical protein
MWYIGTDIVVFPTLTQNPPGMAWSSMTKLPGDPGEPGDGAFSGYFVACDDPKPKDHIAYFTTWFGGGRAVNIDTSPVAKGQDAGYDYDKSNTSKDLGLHSINIDLDVSAKARHI